jgi:hypothetical protein
LELDAKGREESKIIGKDILGTLKDLFLWILMLTLFCNGASLFSRAYFTPSIVAGFKFSATSPCLITWLSNDAAAHTRRATAVALSFTATNLGGIVSTWIYPRSSAPRYRFAARFNLALNCFTLLGIALNIVLLRRRNNEKVIRRGEILAGIDDLDAHEQYEILGDRHPDFKYTL